MDFKGLTFTKTRDEFTSDPQLGNGRLIEWQGDRQSVYGQFSALRNSVDGAQARCSVRQVGDTPYYSLTAVFPDLQDLEPQNPEEQVVDRWTIHTEVLQTDGFSMPGVAEEAGFFETDPSRKGTYRKTLEDGDLSDPGYNILKNSAAGGQPVYPVARDLIVELRRGATHFDDEYVVLRRVRTVSNGSALKINLKAVRLIYDSNKLGVPSNVAFAMPTLPPVSEWPINAYWGWRLRTQSADFVGNRIEQTYEWVLAAWSTFYYARTDAAFPF